MAPHTGLGHAQNVLGFQRVAGPDGRSAQVTFVGQADCLQAYQQNHAPGCNPATDKRHCNDWDQGGIFFDNRDRIWGQPNFYTATMLSLSHLPLVLNVSVEYNTSFPPPPPPPQDDTGQWVSIATAPKATTSSSVLLPCYSILTVHARGRFMCHVTNGVQRCACALALCFALSLSLVACSSCC